MEIYKILFAKANSVADKILYCLRIKLSNLQILNLDSVESGVSLLDLAQPLRGKNEDVPGTHFFLLDATGISPNLILNQNAKAKDRGGWVPLKI